MEILKPARYSLMQAQSTPGFARDMQRVAVQEAAEIEVIKERKKVRKLGKDAAIEANWAPTRITRPIGVVGSLIENFQEQVDEDHADFGRAIPARSLEVTLVGPDEMSKMLAASHTRAAASADPGRFKKVVRKKIDEMNCIISEMRDEQVQINKCTQGAESPDLWLRSIYPDATNWPDNVMDLPQIDESGIVLHGLWAKAELEIGKRVETVGLNTLAVEITGPSADMIVAERQVVLEALHSRMQLDTTLADKSYEPRLELFKTQPDRTLIGANVVQPGDMPYYLPFSEPRATRTELFQPLQ